MVFGNRQHTWGCLLLKWRMLTHLCRVLSDFLENQGRRIIIHYTHYLGRSFLGNATYRCGRYVAHWKSRAQIFTFLRSPRILAPIDCLKIPAQFPHSLHLRLLPVLLLWWPKLTKPPAYLCVVSIPLLMMSKVDRSPASPVARWTALVVATASRPVGRVSHHVVFVVVHWHWTHHKCFWNKVEKV